MRLSQPVGSAPNWSTFGLKLRMFGFWGETLAEGAICDDAEESGEGAAEPAAEVDSWVDGCRSGSTEAVAEGDVFGTGIATASPVVA